MLRSLVRGDIHPSDLQTEEELEEELPEDYFETVCKATEEGDLGVFSITAPDGAEYLYFKPLMSHSYARILAVKDNAEALVCDQIRENSRIYPRPVPSSSQRRMSSETRLRLILMFRRWNVCFNPSDGKKKTRTSSSRRPPPGRFFCTQTNIWTTT